MASHAHSPGDSMSVAKLGLYGTIGAAIIGAVTTAAVHLISGPVPNGPPPSGKPDYVSFNNVQINESGVTVSGFAEKDDGVGVFVAVGPKASGGFWSGYGKVVNQHWQADVATDEPWHNYGITAAYYYGAAPGGTAPAPLAPKAAPSEPAVPQVAPAWRLVSETTSQSALKFTFQGTEPTTPPPPPPPPDQIANCVVQFGPSCFNGPGFGPPSVYHSNQ